MPRQSKHSNELLEDLIIHVRAHSVLYDASEAGHRDRVLISNIWNSIAKVLKITDEDCKKAWKNLRDTFSKLRRENMHSISGQAAKKKSKWSFYQQLTFLEKYLQEKETESNVDFVGEETEDSNASNVDGLHVDPPVDDNHQSPVLMNYQGDDDDVSVTVPFGNNDDNEYATSIMDQDDNYSLQSLDTPNVSTPSVRVNSKSHVDTQESGNVNDTIFKTPKKLKKPIKRTASSSSEPLEGAITSLVKTHEARIKMRNSPKVEEDLFFEHCALRMMKLDPQKKSLLKLQISQLFYNAENPSTPVQITQPQ